MIGKHRMSGPSAVLTPPVPAMLGGSGLAAGVAPPTDDPVLSAGAATADRAAGRARYPWRRYQASWRLREGTMARYRARTGPCAARTPSLVRPRGPSRCARTHALAALHPLD